MNAREFIRARGARLTETLYLLPPVCYANGRNRLNTIIPKLPTADDEYTPEQRRIIDAQLDEAEKGPFHGPFSTAEDMIAHMKSQLKKPSATKKTKRSR